MRGMKSSFPQPSLKVGLETVNAGVDTSHVHVHDKIYSEVGQTLGPEKEHFTYHVPKMLSTKSETYLAKMENILKKNLDTQVDVCVDHMPLGYRNPYQGNIVYEEIMHKSGKSSLNLPTRTSYAPFPEQEHFYLRRQEFGLTNASRINQSSQVRHSSTSLKRASLEQTTASKSGLNYTREVQIANTFEPMKRLHPQLEVADPSPRLQLDHTVLSTEWQHVHRK